MHLPENFEQFKTAVLEKIRTYCDSNIWPFEYEKFCGWLNNFDQPLEEYIALQMLDSLIVRSKEMAIASYSRLLSCELRQYIVENTDVNPGSIESWKKKLKQGSLNKDIRFTPIRLSNDQGESGGSIYRMMSSILSTERYALTNSTKHPQVIILIDDFIGSGDQFITFADEFELNKYLESSHVIYTPLMALSEGIVRIKSEYPSLNVLPAELLDNSDGLFYGKDTELFKNDPRNTIADVKEYLECMKIKYAPKISNWLGYEKAAIPVSFEWGCPNQAPSILYMENSSKRENWNRLFNRRAL